MSGIDIVKSNYVKEIIKRGERLDKRGAFDIREIRIENNPLVNAEGSARVNLGLTDVIAGVKAVIEEPHSDTPKEGNLIVSAELLPAASADFETGPPGPAAIELARVVDRGIRAGRCIDMEGLFLEEGKSISLYVDIYVLDYDGNLFDACSIAAMRALMNTKLPKYENGEFNMEDRSVPLKIESIVSSTTYGKFGDVIVADMNAEEEAATDARLTITTDGKAVKAMQKGLNGSFTIDEVERLVGISLKKHEELKSKMES